MKIEMLDKAGKTVEVDAAWQTGREYAARGQRMSARLLSVGKVAFVDLDRSISGITHQPFVGDGEVNPATLAKFVMNEYDHNRYNSGFYEMPEGHEAAAVLKDQLKEAASNVWKDGYRIPEPHELPGVMDAAVTVLQSYSADALVSELYDNDQEFATALTDLVGTSFEYPDFGYRKIGDVIKKESKSIIQQSAWDAEAIARSKGSFRHVGESAAETVIGRVIGLTSAHAVLSLGRSALIVEQADLSRVPAMGAEVTVAFRGGQGVVAERDSGIAVGR
jgi:hypothetical protein